MHIYSCAKRLLPLAKMLAVWLWETCHYCFFCCLKILFCLQLKCGHHKKVVWPWLVEQIQPTLTELGVPTPEALGYDKPELYLKKTEEF